MIGGNSNGRVPFGGIYYGILNVHPIAVAGYEHDIGALRACDACVLVLPSGRSASWELGYAMGQGKRAAVLQLGKVEPELMYREAEILTSWMALRLAFTVGAT